MTRYFLTASKGKGGKFRRVGRHTKNGKLYWFYSPFGAVLRKRGLLQAVFSPAQTKQAFDQAKRQGMQLKRHIVKTPGRTLAKQWMQKALAAERNYHYLQRRPMKLRTLLPLKGQVYADCSESTTAIAKVGGFPDPNGRGYDGTGYTGTLRQHAKRIPLAQAKVGDYIVHGTGTGVHVVTVYEPHPTDPLCWSHGQENGPRLYRHSVQVAAHGGYFTVHSLEG